MRTFLFVVYFGHGASMLSTSTGRRYGILQIWFVFDNEVHDGGQGQLAGCLLLVDDVGTDEGHS